MPGMPRIPCGSFPAAEYRLTVPKTLLDTEYELVKDDSAATNDEMEKGGYTSGPNERNVKGAVGTYSGTSTESDGATSPKLVLSGMHGQFKDPAQSRTSLLDGMRKADGISEPNPPKTVTPPGSDLDLTCTVFLSEDQGTTSTLPVCAWGDENTAAYVAFVTPGETQQDPDSVDLDAAAKTVLKVREEVRQPIG